MKQSKSSLFAALVATLCLTQSVSAQGEKKAWPAKERVDFITECVRSAQAGLSEDSARFYCYCMLEKMEKKYTLEEAGKLTDADMQSPEMKKDIGACLGGTWSSASRNDFIRDCIATASRNIPEARAKNYCECMLFKIEQRYPIAADAAKLTPEVLSSPEWKRIIADCLNF